MFSSWSVNVIFPDGVIRNIGFVVGYILNPLALSPRMLDTGKAVIKLTFSHFIFCQVLPKICLDKH